ncbi:MAG: hypothetical protein FJ090_17740 [Deltaproteobacteria bacterium]|nr:hypothetical protein [Deltaproteobacteria bacterium]
MSAREAITRALFPSGLNVVGVTSVARWDEVSTPARRGAVIAPWARSILVVGSGGSALWDAFLADLRRDVSGLVSEPHPLDAFVRRSVTAADVVLGASRRAWFWSSAEAEVHLDFRMLAHLAGLGSAGRLGLLMHPEFGPWQGLRAACFIEDELAADPPGGPDLCAGCPAPCLAACPGGAFPDGRWSVDACTAFRLSSSDCAATCHARDACPAGAAHRYSPEEVRYHTDRATGRRWIRAYLGLPEGADAFDGVGPYWGSWRSKVDVKGGDLE